MHPTAILLAGALILAAILLAQAITRAHDRWHRGWPQSGQDAIRLAFAGGIVFFAYQILPDAALAIFGIPALGVVWGAVTVYLRVASSPLWDRNRRGPGRTRGDRR